MAAPGATPPGEVIGCQRAQGRPNTLPCPRLFACFRLTNGVEPVGAGNGRRILLPGCGSLLLIRASRTAPRLPPFENLRHPVAFKALDRCHHVLRMTPMTKTQVYLREEELAP